MNTQSVKCKIYVLRYKIYDNNGVSVGILNVYNEYMKEWMKNVSFLCYSYTLNVHKFTVNSNRRSYDFDFSLSLIHFLRN